MTQMRSKTAPEPLAPMPFNIPPTHTTVLDNGLRIVTLEDRRVPLVGYSLCVLSGDNEDPADLSGLSTALAYMMKEGTASYSSEELARKFENLGANFSISSTSDFTFGFVSTLATHRTEILDLMAEVILRPSFPENELDLYRRNSLEQLKFQRSQPAFLANEQAARILFGSHPYARISPTAEEISRLTREKLIAEHARKFIPNNTILIVNGAVDRETAVAEVEARFGEWQRGETAEPSYAELASRSRRSLTIVDRPGSAQSNIVISDLGVMRRHPDYFPLVVMNQILGAGASSRVFLNLREQKGYTYGAYTRLDTRRFAGRIDATAEVRTAVTGVSIKEFFYELERMRSEDVTANELQDAKNYMTGTFPLQAETQEGISRLLITREAHGLPADYLETYRDSIMAVTAADVRRVANELIHPERMSIVIVGDAADVIPQVKEFADELEMFDTEGSRKDPPSAQDADAPPAEVSGVWDLKIDFQGQEFSAELDIIQTGNSFKGDLATPLGPVTIPDGRVAGSRISGAAVASFQGQDVELNITGTVADGRIEGTLSTPIVPEPLAFAGTRQ